MTRVGKIRERLIRSSFRAIGALAPGPAGRFAFRLFCSPPHRRALTPGEARMAARMAPLMARAERRMIDFDGGGVATYAWRNALSIVARRFADRIGLGDSARGVLEAEIRRVCGRPSEAFVVGEMLARLGKPALVIHDEGDADVPFIRGQEFVAAAAATARLLPTTGVGHRRIVVAPQAIKAAVRFLAEPNAHAAATADTG